MTKKIVYVFYVFKVNFPPTCVPIKKKKLTTPLTSTTHCTTLGTETFFFLVNYYSLHVELSTLIRLRWRHWFRSCRKMRFDDDASVLNVSVDRYDMIDKVKFRSDHRRYASDTSSVTVLVGYFWNIPCCLYRSSLAYCRQCRTGTRTVSLDSTFLV